jgi:hypothetical protein
MVYFGVLSLILVSVSVPFLISINNILQQAGVVQNGQAVLNSANLLDAFEKIDNFYIVFIDFLSVTPDKFLGSALFLMILVLVVARIILGLYQLPLAFCIDGYLSAKANLSFSGKFVSNIWISIRYALTKLVFNLFFDLCMLSIFIAILALIRAFNAQNLIHIIITILFFCMLAIRQAIVCCWTGQVVVGKTNPKKAFKKSIKISFAKFNKLFALYFLCWVLIFGINILAYTFTFGLALIVTIPVCVLFLSVLELITYYSLTGHRYYVDGQVINAV